MTVEWKPIATAPNATAVMTRIDDGSGVRNEQVMTRHGHLWWIESASGWMYVYYKPTHWREIAA